MDKIQLPQTMRRINLVLELEQAIECLRAGLQRVAGGTTVLRPDAATLFLLANGLERYLKVAVHILHFGQHGDFRPRLRNLGHGPLKAEREIFGLESTGARASHQSREDRAFVKDDQLMRALLDAIDAFAETDRYFMLDGAAGEEVDPERSHQELWWEVQGKAAGDNNHALFLDTLRAREVIAKRLIACTQRYLRCIAQAVCNSTTGDARSFATGMHVYLCLNDSDLETVA